MTVYQAKLYFEGRVQLLFVYCSSKPKAVKVLSDRVGGGSSIHGYLLSSTVPSDIDSLPEKSRVFIYGTDGRFVPR